VGFRACIPPAIFLDARAFQGFAIKSSVDIFQLMVVTQSGVNTVNVL